MNISSAIPFAAAYPDKSAASVAPGVSSSKTNNGVAEEFIKYAQMSPLERLRDKILRSMDLTEEKLAAMPAEERQEIEDLIKEKMKQMLKGIQEANGTGASLEAAQGVITGLSFSSDVLGQLLSIQAGQQPVSNDTTDASLV